MTFLAAVVGALFVFLASTTIILLLVGPTMLLQPRRRTAEFYRALGQPLSPQDVQLPYEDINFTTREGFRLNGWLIRAKAPVKGTIIYLHGVADCKIDGIRLAKLMYTNHYNILLYDSRRHGNSDGKFCTYGYYEKHDLISIIDYLVQLPHFHAGNIGLFGTSMGAAIALQAAAIDTRIAAVVAENSFSTLRTIFDDYQRRMIKLPFHYLRNIVIKRSELMANFKANDVSPLSAVMNIHIPTLFIYGTNDHLIDYKYSLMLYEHAGQPKQLFPIENASHNDAWKVAGATYETALLNFFGENLK